jgi:phosphoribosylamine--glycine ligase
VLPLQPAQDFKRAYDGDEGPNTGGMGAYTPLPWAPDDLVAEVCRRVLVPTVEEMARRGTPFQGLLYAGLALTSRGVRVIEFNARFGDPETQSLLAMLRTPLSALLHGAATGTLADVGLPQWQKASSVTVVVASEGYPEAPVTGDVIEGVDDANALEGVDVIHAGTAIVDGRLVTAGGRVLSVTGTGADLAEARDRAYAGVDLISIRGGHHRTDIALAAQQDDQNDDRNAL